MRWSIAVACAWSLAVGVAVLLGTPDFERLPAGGRAIPYLSVLLSWGFVAVGSYAWLRRPDNRTGLLLTLVGVAVSVSSLQLFDVPAPWALGVAADTVVIALLVHLLLAFPSGRLDERAARVAAGLAYAAGALQILLVLFRACEGEDCPANPVLIADSSAVAGVVGAAQGILLAAGVGCAVVLLLRRWRDAGPAQRRGLEPVLLLGAVIGLLGLATGATQALFDDAAKAAQIGFGISFTLLPAAFLLGLVRSRFFHTTTLARLIEQLASAHDLRDALAAALRDPTLRVLYWVDGVYVDGAGRAAGEPAPGQVRTEIAQVAALDHAAALCETPELLRDTTAAAALALENARLEVELRARLEALRASRARIVEAGDAERRRLGRDLHDGAQQRLVSLMIELQLARERLPADPVAASELVDSAFANARAAVDELRDLAAGIHPAVLSQRGLDAALEALASRSPVPVELETRLAERLPIAVETAAYFVVAEALTNVAKYARASHARVDVWRENGCAVVAVRDDGVGGADASGGTGLRGLEDRVGVLDGTLEVASPSGEGTLIRAQIPL